VFFFFFLKGFTAIIIDELHSTIERE